MAVKEKAISPDGIFSGYTNPENYDPPEEDKELAAELKQRFEAAQRSKLNWERIWDLNLSYLRGDTLLGRHKTTGEIVRLSADDARRLRSQNNVLRPTSRSLVGKLAKLIPSYTVSPATADFAEQHGAKVADAILQFAKQKENLDLIFAELCGYLPWAGNSFVQLCWDKLGGKKIAYCQTCNYYSYDLQLVDRPCPTCQIQREQELEAAYYEAEQLKTQAVTETIQELPPDSTATPEDIMGGLETPVLSPEQLGPLPSEEQPPPMVEAYEGDVKVYVRDPRDVYFPPGTRDAKTAEWFCVRTLMSVPAIRRKYPRFARFLKADPDVNMGLASRYNYGTHEASSNVMELPDHTFLYEFHECPTEEYPDGRVICMANDVILDEHPAYYNDLGRTPIYHFGFDPIEGELFREPYISQAWHRQRELNIFETNTREHAEQILKPKLMNPFGSRITEEEFTAQSAQVINYNSAAGRPEWIRPPEIPQGLMQRRMELVQDVRLQAGVTESDAGIAASDPNGRALAIISAEAGQQMGPIIQRNHAEWKDLYKGILIFYKMFAAPERIATIAGPEGVQTYSFAEMQLSPGWDLTMDTEEGSSRNPAIRLNEALQLAGVGYFVDTRTGQFDKKAFARYAKLRVPDAGFNSEATERASASQIPYLLKQGIPWRPRNFDDPTIFQEELLGWLRGPGRQEDPNLSAQVEQVWMFYTQWAMQGMMPGAPMVPGVQDQASQAGSEMSAPGGTPNNPGGMSSGTKSNVPGEAQQTVSGADSAGEGAARQSLEHEG